MNILHVLSQYEVTGAEVYAVTLATAQQRQGHSVFLVSDTLHTPFEGSFIQQPIGKRSYSQRLQNIAFLIQLIRKNNIQIVHAHSRAASWVSRFATHFTKTPFISTVHGRQHMHVSSKLWSVYGKNIVAVSESLYEHLVGDLGIDPKHISVIPNGLDTKQWINATRTKTKKELFNIDEDIPLILFVGRLSGPKGDIVRILISDVLPELMRKTKCSLLIIGGLKVPEDIPQLVREAQKKLGPASVTLRDFQNDLITFFNAADIVIGAGRVVMESLMACRPTFAFGESGYEGLITTNNFDVVRKTNFGDTGIRQSINPELIVQDLVSILQKPQTVIERQELQKRVQEIYDIDVVEQALDTVYQTARINTNSPASIPILMYHRIVKEPPNYSRHGIWVTTHQFEQQLRSLKRRAYTPITFEQYRQFLRGESLLSQKPIILTFDDGYEDNYTQAFSLLKKFSFPAVIFLVTDSNRRTNFWDADEPRIPLMTDNQIREMAETGIEFGSHTVTHPRLSQCSPEQIKYELIESKKAIEGLLRKEIVSLAYPYGVVNETIKSLATESGYSFGIATDSGPIAFSKDFFEICRIQVFPWTSRFGFWKKTQGWYLHYKRWKAR